MKIIGYWRNWGLPLSNEISNWGGDLDLTPLEANSGTYQSSRFTRWRTYSPIARRKELLEESYLDIIDTTTETKTNAQLKQWDLTKWVEELASTNDGL